MTALPFDVFSTDYKSFGSASLCSLEKPIETRATMPPGRERTFALFISVGYIYTLGKPFDISDYTAMLEQAASTARELDTLAQRGDALLAALAYRRITMRFAHG